MTINSLSFLRSLFSPVNMSASSPAATADGNHTTTPVTPTAGGDGTQKTPVRLVHSMSEVFDFFVDILDEDNLDRDVLKSGIESLIKDHWQVSKWSDLKLFSALDVKEYLVTANGFPKELLSPVIIKKVGCVVDYAHYGELTAELTLDDIMMSNLDTFKRKASFPGGAGGSSVTGSPSRNKRCPCL